jgi:hypothetical protein
MRKFEINRRLTAGIMAVLFMMPAVAEDKIAGVEAKVNLGPGETLRSSTVSAKSFPERLADRVIYHFDASDASSWEFFDESCTMVKKIPCDYGDRFLTSAPESTWKPANWGAGQEFEKPHFLASVPALGGKPAVDFGAIGSGRAMVFNPDAANENKNLLSNVGTVIAVWGSEGGGGWLFSGGEGANYNGAAPLSDFLGHRSANNPSTGSTDGFSWMNPLWVDPAWYSVRDAKVYHDGQPGCSKYVGFNGGWEVLSVVMTTKKASLPNTAGLGINDSREGSYYKTKRSGGMGVAEIWYFSEMLDDADRKAVEAYLQAKWFSRRSPGHNGNAEVGLVRVNKKEPNNTPSWGVDAAIEVAKDDILTVTELSGGRRGGTLTKTGEGTLAVGKSDGYGGVLRVAEGAVAFSRRTIPAELPAEPWFRLDASDLDSLETEDADGVTYVRKWLNKAGFPIAGNAAETLCVVSPSESACPVLIEDALGPGRNAIDFGVLFSNRRLEAKGGAGLADLKIPGVTAAFVVMAPTFSGGSVFGNPYTLGVRSFLDRGADDAQFAGRGILSYTLPLWLTKSFHDDNLSMVFDGNSGVTRSNGRVIDPDKGFFSCGWQVLGVTTPGAEISSIGGGRINCTYSGGFRVAEIVLYNRPLTDLEVCDAEAYLANKWLGRPALGYMAKNSPESVELKELALAEGAEVSVPENAVARVGTLSPEGVFVKSGGGKLQVESLPSSVDLQLDGGTIEPVAKSEPPRFDLPAVNPAFHLDASDAKSLVMHPDTCGTTNYVVQWHDVRGSGNVAFCPQPDYAKYAPYVDSTRRQNGNPVVDFGVDDTEYRRLHFNRSHDAVRSVYAVWGTRGKALTAGVLLGSANSAVDIDSVHMNNQYDFLRNSADLFGYWYFTEPVCKNAKIFVDGVATNRTYHPVEGFQLVEVHTPACVHASALNDDRVGSAPTSATYASGMSYGEILIYERELTDREKVATRNYLMKKWFGKTDAELTPLPGTVPAAPEFSVNRLFAGSDSHFSGGIAPADVMGREGSKATVETDMAVGDVNVYTGELVVAAGKTLSVTGGGGALVRNETPELVLDGRIMHLDACSGVETDGNGIVTKWNNLAGGNLHAVASGKPQLRTDGLFDGRPYVYMCGYSWQSGGGSKESRRNCFYFADGDGRTNKLANIRSAFWVLNSKDGGGVLLSGGEELFHNSWYRGRTKQNSNNWCGMVYPDAPILKGDGYAANASWRLNAVEVDPVATGLSGGNDLISMNFRPEDPSGSAWGFAFNAWFHNPNDGTVETCGWQYLAELIIYNRELTDSERRQVEAYLSRKWGLGVYKRTNGESANVRLNAGSTLDLNGNNCGLGALSGSGTVENAGELRVAKIDVGEPGAGEAKMDVDGDLTIADGGEWKVTSGGGPLAVSGTLSFEGAVTFDLLELDVGAEAVDGAVCLATAAEYGALPGRSAISAVGGKHPVYLFVNGGKLYLRVVPRGFTILVR